MKKKEEREGERKFNLNKILSVYALFCVRFIYTKAHQIQS